MAIVGLGGLGKTTLAQLAYHDDEVSRHFQLKSWVCVSEGFDVVRLTEAIVQSLNLEASGITTLDPLQRKLKRILDEQRFLLVLDDVWEAEDLSNSWDRLMAPLRYGHAERKIIITTRSENVSKVTRASPAHFLPCLQDEDCLQLFGQRAFEGRDPNSCGSLKVLGWNIAKKCRGLPLAAKALGGLLHSVDDERTWKEILESDDWDMNEGNEVMPVLRWSYQHLPAHLKRCFRYCSVFPRDHEFDRDQLVRMWTAHGYVKARGRELMEDTGKRYFDDLLSRSFFQHSQKRNYDDLLSWSFFQHSQNSQVFLMHDLIHDLARCVSGDEWCSDDKPRLMPGHVRHFSIVTTGYEIENIAFEGYLSEGASLRSFLLISTAGASLNNIQRLNVLLNRLELLRVLDLGHACLSVFPESITRLKHLRYLRLPMDSMSRLPESVGGLYHLQTLHFGLRCWAEDSQDRLPNSITNLLNLRHLIYKKNVASVEYPAGIGKLTDLQTMPGFHVSLGHDRAKLGELKDLNNIQERLVITGINNLTDVNEAKKACLHNKRNLWSLHLNWDYAPDPSLIDDGVLESLKPSPKLRDLHLSGFKGPSHPSWLGHPSFSRLANIKLEGCQNWTSLPPLGQLPSLESLSISAAAGVEYIGREFFSGGFPRLEILTLENMHDWKSWCGAHKGECPQLRIIHIASCEHLESLSVINLDALQELQISVCPRLSLDFTPMAQLPSLQDICVQRVRGAQHIRGLFPRGDNQMREGKSYLKLINVDQSEATLVLDAFSHTRRLVVEDSADLTSLPLGNLSTLEFFKIRRCPRFQFPSAEPLSPTLRALCIIGCPSVTEWCGRHQVRRLAHLRQSEMQGDGSIYLVLRNVLDVDEVAGLRRELVKVRVLELEWDCCSNDMSSADAMEVLENLCPCTSPTAPFLDKLVIRGYRGSRFASWLGDPLFSTLYSITLLQCSQCEVLPRLAQLPFLMKLHVEGASRLKHVGREFSDAGADGSAARRCSFPNLKRLEFHDMPVWEEWRGTEEGDFPSLCKLILKHCPRLKALPHLPPALMELELEACEQLTSLSTVGSFTQGLDFLKNLRRFSVIDCPMLDFSAS